jgi:hypothetical protein
MYRFEAQPVEVLDPPAETGAEIDAEEAEEKEFTERDPFLQKLWSKYHFMGEAPFEGSPAEDRLYDLCKKYNVHSLDTTKYSIPKQQADGENYFARPKDIASILAPSEASRRELHNQIAMMATGRQRSGMAIERATEIAHFACELIYGCDIHEALELKAEGTLIERER